MNSGRMQKMREKQEGKRDLYMLPRCLEDLCPSEHRRGSQTVPRCNYEHADEIADSVGVGWGSVPQLHASWR